MSEQTEQGSCSSQGSWLILNPPAPRHGKAHHPPDWLQRKPSPPPRYNKVRHLLTDSEGNPPPATARCTINSKHEWGACGKQLQGNGQAGKVFTTRGRWRLPVISAVMQGQQISALGQAVAPSVSSKLSKTSCSGVENWHICVSHTDRNTHATNQFMYFGIP